MSTQDARMDACVRTPAQPTLVELLIFSIPQAHLA
jgi:hypothetical protein